jgi:carboxylesterase type B
MFFFVVFVFLFSRLLMAFWIFSRQISPGSKGLFHQAIMESNPSGFHFRTLDDMKIYGDEFCKFLNCTSNSVCDLQCIQNAPVKAVGDAWNKVGSDIWAIVAGNCQWGHLLGAFLAFTPVVDGMLVRNTVVQYFSASRISSCSLGLVAVRFLPILTLFGHLGSITLSRCCWVLIKAKVRRFCTP